MWNLDPAEYEKMAVEIKELYHMEDVSARHKRALELIAFGTTCINSAETMRHYVKVVSMAALYPLLTMLEWKEVEKKIN